MQIIDAEQVFERLPFDKLIEKMRILFAQRVACPDRHNHRIVMPDGVDASLLLMPGWYENIGCVKIVNVNPDNGKHNLPAVAASVLVFNRQTGEHLALLDGEAVTVRRTAAASALAASFLAPKEAKHLLVVGAGKIAEQLPEAFSAVRPIEMISVWNRSVSGAEQLVKKLQNRGYNAQVTENLDVATKTADIISAATLSTRPLIKGDNLRGNQHIDLIGSFTPNMRETDDAVMQRAAGAIYTDSSFTQRESGDIAIPLENHSISPNDIAGDLMTLCDVNYVHSIAEITIFKGAGNAVMDLAATLAFMSDSGIA